MSKSKKIILRVYFIICAFFVLDCLLYYFKEISLRGYYTDVVLSWVWLISSFVIIIVFWKKLISKLFLAAILVTFALSIMAMMLPFYALLLSSTSLGLYQNKDLNENYRAQIVGYGVMVQPWLEVIEKKGLFEKRIIKKAFKIFNGILRLYTCNLKWIEKRNARSFFHNSFCILLGKC